MNIYKFNDPQSAVNSLAEEVGNSLELVLSAGKNVTLFLSGGSSATAYSKLFGVLSDYIDKYNISLSGLTIAIADERFASGENAISEADFNTNLVISALKNYPMLEKFGLSTQLYNFSATVQDNYNAYKSFVDNTFADPDMIKMAILGIGGNMHIAGVNASQDDKDFRQKFLGGELLTMYSATDYPARITLSLNALAKLDYTAVFISGKPEVAANLEKMKTENNLQMPTDIHIMPAKVLTVIKQVEVFVS